MRDNAVFDVIVINSGSELFTTGGETIGDMAAGDVGIFDTQTKVVAEAGANEVIIVQRINASTTAAKQFNISQPIKLNRVNDVTGRCPVTAVPEVWQLADISAKCNTDYGIKLEIVSHKAFSTHGANLPFKSYVVEVPCCGTDDCTDADCNELATAILEAVNADQDALITASYYDVDGAATITVPNFAAWIIANPDTCIGLRFAVNNDAIATWSNIPNKYDLFRNVKVNLSPIAGFQEGTNSFTQVTAPVYAEGLGYDINQLAYQAEGWKSGVYRTSELVPSLKDFEKPAVDGSSYAQFYFDFEAEAKGGNPHTTSNGLLVAVLNTAGVDEITEDLVAEISTIFGITVSMTGCVD
jgi:hypothetical protein